MKKYLVISLLLTSRLAYTANPDDLTPDEWAAIAQSEAAISQAEQDLTPEEQAAIAQAEEESNKQKYRLNRMYLEQEEAKQRLIQKENQARPALSKHADELRNMPEVDRNKWLSGLKDSERQEFLNLLSEEQQVAYLLFQTEQQEQELTNAIAASILENQASILDEQPTQTPDERIKHSTEFIKALELAAKNNHTYSPSLQKEINFFKWLSSTQNFDLRDYGLPKEVQDAYLLEMQEVQQQAKHAPEDISQEEIDNDPVINILFNYAMDLGIENEDYSAFHIFEEQVDNYDFNQLETIENEMAREHIATYITSLKKKDYQILSLFAHLKNTTIEKILLSYYLTTGRLELNSEKDTITNILTSYSITYPEMALSNTIGRKAEEKLNKIIIYHSLPVVASSPHFAMFKPLADYAAYVSLPTQAPNSTRNWSKTPNLDKVTQIHITNYIPHLPQNDFKHLMALAHLKYTTPEYILAEYYKATGNLNNSVPVSTVLQQYVDTHPDMLQYSARTIELEKAVHASNQQSLTSAAINSLRNWWNKK